MPTLDTNCWVSVADLKEHLDTPAGDTSKDSFLTNVLNGAYQLAKNYIGHDLVAADYTEYYDGDGEQTLLLNNYPINSIASIYIDSSRTFGTEALVDSTDYYFDAKTGLVTMFQGSASFQAGKGNIKITYNAGYTTIPYDAQRGLIMLAAWLSLRAGTEGFTAATLGGKSEQYEGYNIPLYIRQCFIPYKNIGV